MLKAFPFRALSPHHATAMDREYLLRVVDAAGRYGFNALQICGDTHGEGNLDGITEFRRFERANRLRDVDAVRARREILRDVCRAAHDRGLEVYYWHHELWFPLGLEKLYPQWFVPAPQNRFSRDLRVAEVPRVEPGAPFWEFLDAKFDEAFAQCPELDGTVITIQESHVPVYCLHEDFERQVAALVDLYRRLAAAHQRVGRKWIVRTFAWREHEYRVVAEAIRRWGPPVPVESKGVPMDWSFFYPYDRLLGEFPGSVRHVEIAPSGEFHGCGGHPVGHPWFYTENLRFAAERGHTGAAVRMDRAGSSLLGSPDEGVLACIGAWLNDPGGTDVGEVYVGWMMGRYGVDRAVARRLVYEVMESCWEAALRCYHHDRIYIGDSFWLQYDRMFFVGERHLCVEHEEDEPLAEKDRAVELADRAAAVLEELRAALKPPDARDLARRLRFLQLTCRSYRALIAALLARQRQMYLPSDDRLAGLRSAVDALEAAGRDTSREFPELNDDGTGAVPSQRQPGVMVERFARAFRADLANLPRRRILCRLAAGELGANAEFRGAAAHQPPAEGERIVLQGRPGAGHVLVVFAGTEMCRRRPLELTCGPWRHRFDVGQYAWFLAHDRWRRYEVELPGACTGPAGRCAIELTCPEPESRPYLREVRLEVETAPVRGT